MGMGTHGFCLLSQAGQGRTGVWAAQAGMGSTGGQWGIGIGHESAPGHFCSEAPGQAKSLGPGLSLCGQGRPALGVGVHVATQLSRGFGGGAAVPNPPTRPHPPTPYNPPPSGAPRPLTPPDPRG